MFSFLPVFISWLSYFHIHFLSFRLFQFTIRSHYLLESFWNLHWAPVLKFLKAGKISLPYQCKNDFRGDFAQSKKIYQIYYVQLYIKIAMVKSHGFLLHDVKQKCWLKQSKYVCNHNFDYSCGMVPVIFLADVHPAWATFDIFSEGKRVKIFLKDGFDIVIRNGPHVRAGEDIWKIWGAHWNYSPLLYGTYHALKSIPHYVRWRVEAEYGEEPVVAVGIETTYFYSQWRPWFTGPICLGWKRE